MLLFQRVLYKPPLKTAVSQPLAGGGIELISSDFLIIQWFVVSTSIVLFSKCTWKEKIEMWLTIQGVIIGLVLAVGMGYLGYLWLSAYNVAG